MSRMTDKIQINKYLLIVLLLIGITGGAFGGYHFTKNHYETKETKQFADDQKNLICQSRIQRGHTGDVKSDYYIIEQSAKEDDCGHYIDYKNIPDDTESVWLGF